MKQVLLFYLFILSATVRAQTCQTSLTEANRAYYNGQLQQVSQLLEPCLNSDGFDKADRIAALKLLVDTKLLQNQDGILLQFLSREFVKAI